MPDPTSTPAPPPRRRPKRSLRYRLMRAFIIVLLVTCGLFCGAVYSYNELGTMAVNRSIPEIDRPWHDDAQDVAIDGDGVQLRGWYVPSQNGRAIILLHGYGGDRTQLVWHADQLYAAGYGLLLMDMRGHGESPPVRRSYGWEDAFDVPGMAAFLQDQGIDNIGIVGHSIGGQVAIRGAALTPEIDAVFADGPSFAQSRDVLPINAAGDPLIILFGFAHDLYSSMRLDMPVPPPVRADIAELAPRPVFIAAAAADEASEWRAAQSYADAGGEHVTLWRIDGARHGGGWGQDPAGYAERLITFFENAFAHTR